MGFLSGLFSFFKKIWNSIKKILKKILDVLGPLLPILIIAFVWFAPAILPWIGEFLPASLGALFTTAGNWVGTLGAMELTALAVGAAAIIAPSETAALIENIGENLAQVAESVGGAIGDIVGGVLGGVGSSIFSSNFFMWLLIGGAGFVAYKVLLADDDDDRSRNKTIEGEING